jgi:hypothetical protein
VNYQSTPNGEQRSYNELTGKEQITLRGKELKEGEVVKPTLKGW